MSAEDRNSTRDYYDELGDAEWTRLTETRRGQVSFEVHRQFLARFVSQGAAVLEVGAGPGRFTAELAALGARVAVTDLSAVQLDLHRLHVGPTAAEGSVVSRELLDVCDTSRYADGEFDAVVAYGGPLSYAFEEAQAAMEGLLRIVSPGGVVVASVMSLLGTWRYFLAGVVEEARVAGEEVNDLVLTTGDMRPLGSKHVCQMFRARDVVELVDACRGEVVAMSASNWASLGDEEALEELASSPDRWARFVAREVVACEEPGALDGGTHLLFAARPRLGP